MPPVIRMRRAAVLLCLAAALSAAAFEPDDEQALASIRAELRCARTGLRALVLAAHPADASPALLARLRRTQGFETHLCLFTRGESGMRENSDLPPKTLAVKHTQEAEAAALKLGVQAWYLNLPDLGYAQSAEAAIKGWNRDRALGQLVRLIRIVRPQAVVTLDGPDGQQQAAELLAAEALAAAADKTQFDKQMRQDGSAPWTVLKHFRCGREPDEKISFENLPLESTPELRQAIDEILPHVREQLGSQTLGARLAALLASARNAGETVRAHLQAAALEALGVRAEAAAAPALAACGEQSKIAVSVFNRGGETLRVRIASVIPESQHWQTDFEKAARQIKAGETARFSAAAQAQPRAYPTFPPEEQIFSRMQMRRPVNAELGIALDKPGMDELKLRVPVPLDLAPPLDFRAASDPVLIFDDPGQGDDILLLAKFRVLVTNYRSLPEPLRIFAGIDARNGAPADNPAALLFRDKGEILSGEFRFMAPVSQLNQGGVSVPMILWTTEKNLGGPEVHLRRVPVKLPPRLNVAVVCEAGGAILDALRKLARYEPGLTVQRLADKEIHTASLNEFHTILIDGAHGTEDVLAARGRLMQFMQDGGNVVCLGPDAPARLAPFELELAGARVCDPQAPVRMLKPEHILLREPCKIWERDFQGWVLSRGTGFAAKWGAEFAPLLSSNDAGKPAQDGGLLVAETGLGSFIHTGFSWPRQLRAGVPGAYRMLANLISYPRTKKSARPGRE